MIKLASITKQLSYQYAIYYYYFAVENDHWENSNGWLNGLFQELPNTIFIIIKMATTTKLLSYHPYTQKQNGALFGLSYWGLSPLLRYTGCFTGLSNY